MRSVNSRTVCTFLIVLVIALGLVSMRIPVGKTSPHDLDVPLPTGAHIYVDYDSAYTGDERRVTSGNLTIYLPLMAEEFWMISRDAIVMMKVCGESCQSGAWGQINYDAGKIVSYSGEVSLNNVALKISGGVFLLLHEWTHVFQGWIPNYPRHIGLHIESVADAFASALIFEQLGWDSSEYRPKAMTTGQLVSGSSYGLARYLRAIALGGYELAQGWEGLWYHDRQAFKKFNTLMASLPSGSPVSFREIVRRSLFEGYADYAYDGLSVDDWLDAFSFYNSISDVPEGSKMMYWESMPWVVFDGTVFVRSGTQASEVLFSSYDIAIYDAQTHELLYSKTREPPYCSSGFCSIAVWNDTFPMHDVLRIDAVAHLDGGDLPVVAYIAARHNDHGDRVIFFLNRDGYAEGSGSSNVGAVQNGFVRWTSGDNVEATVTWSGGTYTYVIENIMAHPAMRMHQIAVPLYKSRTWLSPLVQSAGLGAPAQFTVHLSPKVSTGTVTVYESTDQVNWSPIAPATPTEGLASFSLTFSEAGTHYLKAAWSGDGTINSSESSIVAVTTSTLGSLSVNFDKTAYYASDTVHITGDISTPSCAWTYTSAEGLAVAVTIYDPNGLLVVNSTTNPSAAGYKEYAYEYVLPASAVPGTYSVAVSSSHPCGGGGLVSGQGTFQAVPTTFGVTTPMTTPVPPPGPGIPGFSIEAILIGLVGGLVALVRRGRRGRSR